MCVCVCVRACVRVCARARVCVCVCVSVCVCVCVSVLYKDTLCKYAHIHRKKTFDFMDSYDLVDIYRTLQSNDPKHTRD